MLSCIFIGGKMGLRKTAAQAYFSGQKSVDEFISNLENRVQTVINEQG